MADCIKYVGLDVHKATIAVAIAEAKGGAVRYWGEMANTPEAVETLVRQLKTNGVQLSFCYEAGPCGYGLHRQLTDLGWDCQVVAPSLIPKRAGDRVKTDRRDSMSLARLLRAGELTAVEVPDADQEALRDLTRARKDLKHLQRQAKQRLLAFLLRHGRRTTARATGRKPTTAGWRRSSSASRRSRSSCKSMSTRCWPAASGWRVWRRRSSAPRRHRGGGR